jgi:hypothetical protein
MAMEGGKKMVVDLTMSQGTQTVPSDTANSFSISAEIVLPLAIGRSTYMVYVETEFYRDGCANRTQNHARTKTIGTYVRPSVRPPLLDRQQFEFLPRAATAHASSLSPSATRPGEDNDIPSKVQTMMRHRSGDYGKQKNTSTFHVTT